MVDEEVISRKLSQLRSYADELEKAHDIDWEKYRTDLRARAFVERYIHLSIEKTFDIGNHLISFHQWREPEGYRDIFSVLNEHGVIPDDNLEHFQRMASFRNILVHRYEKIDDSLVFGYFTKRLNDFHLFIDHVKKWVKIQKRKKQSGKTDDDG